MISYAQKQALTVPNSLALATAAILVWSVSGSTDGVEQFNVHCSVESAAASIQPGDYSQPYMTAIPVQCQEENSNHEPDMRSDEIIAKTVKSLGLRLLYLPAKALVNNQGG